MKPSAMTEALKRKKARALDISILIDGDDAHADGECAPEMGMQAGQEMKDGEMAPEAEVVGEEEMSAEGEPTEGNAEEAMIAEELAKAGLGRNSLTHRVMGKMGQGAKPPMKK